MHIAETRKKKIQTKGKGNRLMKTPLLSIIIPTYNRPGYANVQAFTVKELLDRSGISYEIIISDNCSKVPVDKKYSWAKYYRLDDHKETVESHIALAVFFATGEYIWFLGDDDSIHDKGFFELIKAIKKKRYDYILANSHSVIKNGIVQPFAMKIKNPDKIKTMPELFRVMGPWYSMAGISAAVFRKKDVVKWSCNLSYIHVENPIYSHVFAHLLHFWRSKVKYISTPLVYYSETKRDDRRSKHWGEVSKRNGVFYYYNWTLGFVRQYRYIKSKLSIPEGFAARIMFTSWDRNTSPLLNHAANALWHELTSIKNVDTRLITKAEIDEIMQFLVSEDSKFSGLYRYIVSCDYDQTKMVKHVPIKIVKESGEPAVLMQMRPDPYIDNMLKSFVKEWRKLV